MNNKLNIKIAFFDIDGTLINSNKEITNKTINTVNKVNNNNIETFLCSGRSNSYMLNYTNKFNKSKYIISSNGSRIYNICNDETIYANLLTFNNIKTLWNYSNKNNLSCTLTSDNFSFVNKYTNTDTHDYITIPIKKIDNINILKDINIYQIIIKCYDYNKINKLEKYIEQLDDLKIINCTSDYLNKNDIIFSI